jgi:nicotinate-nucleotide pyrophosphorylase (carboxylating)
LEASGGITSENIVALASTGVDIVSLGEITHSPKALNLSLEITKTQKNQTGT